MTYILSFSPWIAYAALSSLDWRIAMGAAAACALALVIHQLTKHDADLLSYVTLGFFAVMTVIALAAPRSGIHHWTPALSAGVLAVIAWASLGLRRPFTLGIAKRQTPEEYWSSPLFLRTNDVITSAWAIAFTASCVVCALIIHHSANDSTALVITQVAGFVLPMLFTKRYTEMAKAKGAALRTS
jgi:hypothetical protein